MQKSASRGPFEFSMQSSCIEEIINGKTFRDPDADLHQHDEFRRWYLKQKTRTQVLKLYSGFYFLFLVFLFRDPEINSG